MHIEFPDLIHGLRVALLLAAFAGFAWALTRSRRHAEQANTAINARLDTALTEIRKLSMQLVVLGETVAAVDTRLIEAPAPKPAPMPATATVNTRGYETAIRLARRGASIEEIVASCGTTRAEARLLRRLHECGEPRRAETDAARTG